MAVRSNALVCGRLSAGNAHSNPAEGMDVRLLCLLCTALVVASAPERKLAPRNHTWCVCVSVCELDQCSSTVGQRPGTGPWHQLYRAARDSPGIDN